MDRQREIDWSETKVSYNHLICGSDVGLEELEYGDGLYLDAVSVVGYTNSPGRSSGHGQTVSFCCESGGQDLTYILDLPLKFQ